MPSQHPGKAPDSQAVAPGTASNSDQSASRKESSFAALPLDNFDLDSGSDGRPDPRPRRHFSPYFALCLSFFSLAFCCFLVHGAVARQPTHLLPFFFLQVFDFIISLLTIVGYMSSTSGVRMWLHTKNGSVYVSSMGLAFLMLAISCMVLALKLYCLGMVWDCYKYLMLTYHTPDGGDGWYDSRFGFLPSFFTFLSGGSRRRPGQFQRGSQPNFEGGGDATRGPPAPYDQTNDLPDYEDALKIPANAYAPPPYFGPTTKDGPPADKTNTQSDTTTRPPTSGPGDHSPASA